MSHYLNLDDSSSDDDDILTYKALYDSKPDVSCDSRQQQQRQQEEKSKEHPASLPLTPEQIEARAIQTVQESTLPLVDMYALPDTLGWYRFKQKKKIEIFYPCRKCINAEEYKYLDGIQPKKNQVVIRRLGVESIDGSKTFGVIPSKSFVSYDPADAEEHLDNFLQFLRVSKSGGCYNDPLKLRVEELMIRAMWEKILCNNTKASATQPTATFEKGDNNDEAPGQPVLLPEEATTTKEQHPFTPPRPLGAKKTNGADDSEDGGCSSSDDCGSPTVTHKRERLRDGDIIEYYDPIGVFGRPMWLKRATIYGVDAKGKMPLNLSSCDFLERSHPIRRLAKRFRNETVPCENSKFQEISSFALHKCGAMKMVALGNAAKAWKTAIANCRQEVEAFWEKDTNRTHSATTTALPPLPPVITRSDEDEPEDDATAKVPAKPGQDRKRKRESTVHVDDNDACTGSSAGNKRRRFSSSVSSTFVSSDRGKAADIVAMKELLVAQKESETHATATKRRYTPHVSISQLDDILKLWDYLATIDGEVDEILSNLASVLNVPLRVLTFVLCGDGGKQMSQRKIGETLQVLQGWMNTNVTQEGNR